MSRIPSLLSAFIVASRFSPRKCSWRKVLRPVQTGNVWWPKMPMLKWVAERLKHRSNNWYKPLSKRSTHARIKHVWCVTNKISPIKHENKRNVLSFWSFVWCLQILSSKQNTIKQNQTRWPNSKCLVAKHCLLTKHFSFAQSFREGVNGVNRLATKGEKILLTTDKTREKLPTSDKKINWDLPTTDKGRKF